MRAGEYDAAEDLARTALALQSEHGSSEQQQSALSTLAWTVLRNSRNEQHRHEEADRLATEAYAIALRGSPTAIELARLERLRAEILRQLGANDRGLELARHALERLEAESAVPAYERATTINQVAVLEESTGNYEAATESFTAVHRTLADLLGEHPDVAGALSNVGTSIAASGRFAAAAEVLLEAVALYDRVLDPEHPMTLNCVSSAAHAVQWSGNLSAAESLHRRVADGLEIALGAEHIFIPMARAFLAENLALQDRLDEAEKVLRASGRDRKRLEGSWMLLSYASIQAFVAGLGAESEATTAELERTYRELVESFGPNVRSAADARRRLELYKDRWSL